MTDPDAEVLALQPRLTLARSRRRLAVLLLLVASCVRFAKWRVRSRKRSCSRHPPAQACCHSRLRCLISSSIAAQAIKYGGVESIFTRSKEKATAGTGGADIGVSFMPVTDSATTQILDTLNNQPANYVVVVDSKTEGWWETRLRSF